VKEKNFQRETLNKFRHTLNMLLYYFVKLLVHGQNGDNETATNQNGDTETATRKLYKC